MMGIAAGLVWDRIESNTEAVKSFGGFALQLALNALYICSSD
jgi:tryptophan-rich sensory protein